MQASNKKTSSKNQQTESQKRTTHSSKKNTQSNSSAETSLLTTKSAPNPEVIKTMGKGDVKIYTLFLGPKISTYTGTQLNDHALSMHAIQKFMGVRKPVTGVEENMILEFIHEFYSDFSTPEIEHAFKLASAAQLPGLNYERDEQAAFNDFNSVYVGKILRAYQSARGKAIKTYQEKELELIKETQQASKEKEAAPTPEQRFDALKQLSIQCFNLYKNGATAGGKERVYDFLTEIKIILHTDSMKENFQSSAKINLIRKESARSGNTQSIRKVLESVLPNQAIKAALESETKRVALSKFFNDLLDMSTHLEELFPKILTVGE